MIILGLASGFKNIVILREDNTFNYNKVYSEGNKKIKDKEIELIFVNLLREYILKEFD